MEPRTDPPRKIVVGKLKGVKTNFPGTDFDPLKATKAELEKYCLPTRPDEHDSPIAYANWVRAMASRPQFPTNSERAALPTQQILTITHPNESISQETSRNWSGAAVRPRTFAKMALIQGRWIVPDTPPFDGGPGYASSIWVGFDGHDPASQMIPQIGTNQIAVEFESIPFDVQGAWWQLWVRDSPTLWEVPIPISVNKKDKIYAQIQAFSDTLLSLYLKNESTNSAYAAYYDVTADWPGRGIERRTAEWIVERPLVPDSLGNDPNPIRVPFADYGETAFTDCNVVTAAHLGVDEFQLQRANLIRMNLWDDMNCLGRLASEAERISDDALLMRYVDAP